jgi:hypothetical protein
MIDILVSFKTLTPIKTSGKASPNTAPERDRWLRDEGRRLGEKEEEREIQRQ